MMLMQPYLKPLSLFLSSPSNQQANKYSATTANCTIWIYSLETRSAPLDNVGDKPWKVYPLNESLSIPGVFETEKLQTPNANPLNKITNIFPNLPFCPLICSFRHHQTQCNPFGTPTHITFTISATFLIRRLSYPHYIHLSSTKHPPPTTHTLQSKNRTTLAHFELMLILIIIIWLQITTVAVESQPQYRSQMSHSAAESSSSSSTTSSSSSCLVRKLAAAAATSVNVTQKSQAGLNSHANCNNHNNHDKQ